MLVLNREQRRVLVDKWPDVANIAAGAMVFGQLLSDRAFSVRIAALGLVVWTVLLACSVLLARRSE